MAAKIAFNGKAFRKYLENTSWMLAERVLNIGFGVVVGVLVARYLGPEKFGLLNYAISFVFLFTPLSALGMEAVIVRNLVNSQEKRDEVLGTAFLLKLGGALSIFLFLFVAVQFTENDRFNNLLIFIVAGGVLFQPFNVVELYFQARVQSKFIVFVKSSHSVVSAAIRLALIYYKAELIWFAIVILLESAFLGAGLGLIYLYKNSRVTWRYCSKTARALLKEALPLLLSGIAVTIYMKVDQVMIKEMLDSKALGHYAVAVRLCEAMYFIPVVIASSLFPAIVEAKKRDEALYYDRIQKLYNLMVVLSIAIAATISFLGEEIVALLFGPEFYEAANVLKIYAWSSIFVFLGVASGKWLITERLTHITLQRALAGCVINVTLNILLIPKYGITGAAFATVAAQATSAYLYDMAHRRTHISFRMKTKALTLYGLIR